MLQAERQSDILELVRRAGRVTVAELCARHQVSEMTIRRDLRDLDRRALLHRVHGGAVSRLGRSYEPPYQLRTNRGTAAKAAIGRKAADLILDGDSLALDVGTTTLEIARALDGKHDLTILTASLPIANHIVSSSYMPHVRLIITGGIVRPGELSIIGDLAAQTYRQFHVDKAFIGVGGISLQAGLTEYNLEDALVKRTLLETANQKIVVADGSKFGRTTFSLIGSLQTIDTIITDESAPGELVASLMAMGIEVIVVQTESDGSFEP